MINEKDTEEIARKVLLRLQDNIKKDIADSFYKEMQNFLYEHYSNHKDKITQEIVKEITEDFQKDSSSYLYHELRKKLFRENEKEMVANITKDILENILIYNATDNYDSCRWKDAIIELILKNWDSFKNDQRIQEGFGRKIESQKNRIIQLERLIDSKEYNNE